MKFSDRQAVEDSKNYRIKYLFIKIFMTKSSYCPAPRTQHASPKPIVELAAQQVPAATVAKKLAPHFETPPFKAA